MLLNVPFMFILITLCSFTGLVMFAFYADCDPLKTHEVENPNQVGCPITMHNPGVLFPCEIKMKTTL